MSDDTDFELVSDAALSAIAHDGDVHVGALRGQAKRMAREIIVRRIGDTKEPTCQMVRGFTIDIDGDPGIETYCTDAATHTYEDGVRCCAHCTDKMRSEGFKLTPISAAVAAAIEAHSAAVTSVLEDVITQLKDRITEARSAHPMFSKSGGRRCVELCNRIALLRRIQKDVKAIGAVLAPVNRSD